METAGLAWEGGKVEVDPLGNRTPYPVLRQGAVL